MKRGKKLVFVSHCVLNQNAVVESLARAKGAYKDIVRTILEHDVGIHQLPCPEFKYLGIGRKSMTKEEYDTGDYRKITRRIGEETVKIIKEYLANDYKILGIIGINESPTCSITGNKGIFIEELFKLLEANHIELPFIDIPVDYYDGESAKLFIDKLNIFLTV